MNSFEMLCELSFSLECKDGEEQGGEFRGGLAGLDEIPKFFSHMTVNDTKGFRVVWIDVMTLVQVSFDPCFRNQWPLVRCGKLVIGFFKYKSRMKPNRVVHSHTSVTAHTSAV